MPQTEIVDSLVWSLTNTVASLVLPPGIFFLLIAIGLWQSGKRRWARWLAGVSLLAFFVLSLNVTANALYGIFERSWPPLDPVVARRLAPEEAVIVVLGGGRVLGAIDYPEGETLSSASIRRAIYGARLAAQTGLPVGVSGGSPEGGRTSEATPLKNLIEGGFGQSVAFVEDRSFDTRQNALNMAQMLTAQNISTVVLVTDVYQMPRSVRAFEAAGLKVVAAPMYFRASAPLNVTDFTPSMVGLEHSRYVLREFLGEVWYRARRAL